MPKQKPHILLLSVGLVLLFGFTACVMAKTYSLFEAVEQNGGNSDRIREYGFLQAL